MRDVDIFLIQVIMQLTLKIKYNINNQNTFDIESYYKFRV